MLAQMYRRQEEHGNGYERGAEYILAVHLLSKCDSLIASGACMAVGEAVKMKEGSFRNQFVFDLGQN